MLTIYKTSDGSDTIYDDSKNNYYHSVHGALTESMHVFIKHGLQAVSEKRSSIRLFELGFGTGLNAYLSLLFTEAHSAVTIDYTAIEKFPLPESIYKTLNYPSLLRAENDLNQFQSFHACSWNQKHRFSNQFTLNKLESDILEWETREQFELIFMDAFSPNDQPELWTEKLLEKFYNMLAGDGLLTTYCAKGIFKRNLRSVGFRLECPPGPSGKREMTVAYK